MSDIGLPKSMSRDDAYVQGVADAESRMSDEWKTLMAEARAFEEWYLPARMSVNAWVGVDTMSDRLYGGWSVDGDPLYDEWDESVMTTAEGSSPKEVIADLIRIARSYRERLDAEQAELNDDPSS